LCDFVSFWNYEFDRLTEYHICYSNMYENVAKEEIANSNMNDFTCHVLYRQVYTFDELLENLGVIKRRFEEIM
jgi:hypothetical protein